MTGRRDDEVTWVRDDEDQLVPRPGPAALGEVVDDLVRSRRGWSDRLEGAAIYTRWEQIVGTDLAERCEPVRLAGGKLVIAVPTEAWATQVRYLADEIVRRADDTLRPGLVQRVDVVVRPNHES